MGLRTWLTRKTGINFKSIADKHRNALSEIASKRMDFLLEADTTQVIALGASHGANAFYSSVLRKKAFNLCSSNQDLFYSYYIYNRNRELMTSLETVVLFFGVFSFGAYVRKSSRKELCAVYKYCYDIDWEEDAYSALYLELLGAFEGKYPLSRFQGKTSLGYIKPKVFYFSEKAVEERVKNHMRMYAYGREPMEYLYKLLNECKVNNHKLLIVLSPTQKSYFDLVPRGIFKELSRLADEYEHVEVVNLFDSSPFLDSDFGDCDHMNVKGAEKLSKLLNNFV